MRGVTLLLRCPVLHLCISTHTPHARRDLMRYPVSLIYSKFQLTRLMRGVTAEVFADTAAEQISTHTPHARRDFMRLIMLSLISSFQLTRLMRGVTGHGCCSRCGLSGFQLTRLMRGVTDKRSAHVSRSVYFNSHASCEA